MGVSLNGADQEAVLIIEPMDYDLVNQAERKNQLCEELLCLAASRQDCKLIKKVLCRNKFPVDVRHNAKIKRDMLADWAKQELNL